jgi:hypothetical protein
VAGIARVWKSVRVVVGAQDERVAESWKVVGGVIVIVIVAGSTGVVVGEGKGVAASAIGHMRTASVTGTLESEGESARNAGEERKAERAERGAERGAERD